ncbi:MAG: NAD(P)H-binding protein [Pseudomonadota bacterium]
MASVLVLGAKGRMGRAAVTAFSAAGWDVSAFARDGSAPVPGVRQLTGDVLDVAALTRACADQDVIVNAVNPPYHHWADLLPRITDAVITVARTAGATVMIPGNVYVYGSTLPNVLREDTPWVGNTRKGAIRIRMENAYRDSGVRTIVVRAGDFFEGTKTGNWFEDHIAAQADRGRFRYPGPLDVDHAWAYLPDLARAMVGLAEQRDTCDSYEEFGFAGYTLTGHALAQHVGRAVEQTMRHVGFPWAGLRLMALGSPLMREVLEMRYLWQRPHRVNGAKLTAALPGFVPTPVEEAIERAMADPASRLAAN